MSSRSAARGRAAASSIRVTSRTSKAVATRRAKPSRCFLFCRGKRAAKSAPIAAATVSIPPIPGLSRLTAHPLQSHQGARTPGNLMGGKGGRLGPLGRRHGDGEGRPRHQGDARHPERGRERRHGAALRAEHLPNLVLELAAQLPDGEGRLRRGPPERGDHHVALHGGVGADGRVQVSRFTKATGKVVEELVLPFPEVEFQALITRLATLKPDAVYAFFAGGGAVKFVKDYEAAGLKRSIPLYGSGFLTDGTIEAQGSAADGIRTGLHYADDVRHITWCWIPFAERR